MTLPFPKAVIFDWDNTLVDTWPVIHKALNLTFAELKMRAWDIEQTKLRVRKSMRDSFPELFGPEWQAAGARYQQHYRNSHLSMLTPLPEAERVLDAFAEKNVPMVIVSNKKGPNLRTEVAHLGWNDRFQAIIGADDAARDKPHPDPVHLALSHIEQPAGPEVWFIGDSDIDLETAAATGCTPILFGDFAPTRPEFTASHYHGQPYARFVETHPELEELIKSI